MPTTFEQDVGDMMSLSEVEESVTPIQRKPAFNGSKPDLQGFRLPLSFRCDLCPRRFHRVENPDSHSPCHTDERLSLCTRCGRAYKRNAHIMQPFKRYDSEHNGAQKFTCRGELKQTTGDMWGCGQVFGHAELFAIHLASKAGFSCVQPLLDEEAQNGAEGLPERSRVSSQGLSFVPADLYSVFQLPITLINQHPELQPYRNLPALQPFRKPSASHANHEKVRAGNLTWSGKALNLERPRQPAHKTEASSTPVIASSTWLQGLSQEFIAHFGDGLIEKTCARVWALAALARHGPAFIELELNRWLRQYAKRISTRVVLPEFEPTLHKSGLEGISEQILWKRIAAELVREHAPKISKYFCDYAPSEHPDLEPIEDVNKQLSFGEIVSPTGKTEVEVLLTEGMNTNSGKKHETANERLLNSDMIDLKQMMDYLVAGPAFQQLASRIRTLYFDGMAILDDVRLEVALGIQSDASLSQATSASHQTLSIDYNCTNKYTAQLNIRWKLQEFMNSQYELSKPSIKSLVVLTGSALFGEAKTYAKYLEALWPKHSKFFLNTLDRAVELGWGYGVLGRLSSRDLSSRGMSHFIAECFCRSIPILRSSTDMILVETDDQNNNIALQLSAGTCDPDVCSINGDRGFIIDILQMLAFTGAALNLSPYEGKLAYCKPDIRSCVIAESKFELSFGFEELHPSEECCWLSMFSGACIARDFPISDRENEIGLEIPIEIMAAIAGASHMVEFEDSLIIKGFSCMLVPTGKCDDRVQWHWTSSDNIDTRITYREAIDRNPNRARLDQVNLQNIHNTRAIVGWCRAAHKNLGSATADYDNLDYSTAQQSSGCMKVSGGSLGFQQIGLAQLNFALGLKDGKCHFQRKDGPFSRILSVAQRTPIVLYDTSDKRAWLISAAEAILHMCHHRHVLEPFKVNGGTIKLPFADVNGLTASQILQQNAKMDLSDVESYKFTDMIKSIWSLLEFLIDQNVSQDCNSGVSISPNFKDVIRGFEFKAVVQESSPFRQKQTSIQKSCGGWPILAKDIDALVLFASGFGNIIQPITDHDQNQQLCHMWSTMPKDRDYLGACVTALNDLYDVSGYRLDRTYLTSTHLQWHRGSSSLFEACTTPGAYLCKCCRLQQIVQKSAIGHVIEPGTLVENGAVIFGQSESPFHDLSFIPPKPKVRGLYSQPNATFEFTRPSGVEADEASSLPILMAR